MCSLRCWHWAGRGAHVLQMPGWRSALTHARTHALTPACCTAPAAAAARRCPLLTYLEQRLHALLPHGPREAVHHAAVHHHAAVVRVKRLGALPPRHLQPPPRHVKGVRHRLPRGACQRAAPQAGGHAQLPLILQACSRGTGGAAGGEQLPRVQQAGAPRSLAGWWRVGARHTERCCSGMTRPPGTRRKHRARLVPSA